MEAITDLRRRATGTRNAPFRASSIIEQDEVSAKSLPRDISACRPDSGRLLYGLLVTATSCLQRPELQSVESPANVHPAPRAAIPEDRKVKSTIHWYSARTRWKPSAHLLDAVYKEETKSGTGSQTERTFRRPGIHGKPDPTAGMDKQTLCCKLDPIDCPLERAAYHSSVLDTSAAWTRIPKPWKGRSLHDAPWR